MRKGDDVSIQQYADSIVGTENWLAANGYVLPSMEKIFALLEGITVNYGMICTIVRKDDSLSFEQVVEKLQVREDKLTPGKLGKSSGGGQRGTTLLTNKSGKAGKDGKCQYCHKKGQFKREFFYNADSPNYKPHLKLRRGQNREQPIEVS